MTTMTTMTTIKSMVRFYRTINHALTTVLISNELHEILLGCLLGNIHIERPSINHNSRCTIKQSGKNISYVEYLFWKFFQFCGSKYKEHFGADSRPNRAPVHSAKFNTLSLPQFNVYRERFYDSNGRKIVPDDIADDFTALSLAHWYTDTGYKAHGGYYIPVNKFIKEDQVKLLTLLQKKFGISCVLRVNNKNTHIFISPQDFFFETVKPYMNIPSLSDKLYL